MVTKKTSSTTKAETATVKAEKKETAAAKAIETKKDTTKKLETKAAVLVDTPEVQAEEVKETVKKAAKKVAAKAEDVFFVTILVSLLKYTPKYIGTTSLQCYS